MQYESSIHGPIQLRTYFFFTSNFFEKYKQIVVFSNHSATSEKTFNDESLIIISNALYFVPLLSFRLFIKKRFILLPYVNNIQNYNVCFINS